MPKRKPRRWNFSSALVAPDLRSLVPGRNGFACPMWEDDGSQVLDQVSGLVGTLQTVPSVDAEFGWATGVKEGRVLRATTQGTSRVVHFPSKTLITGYPFTMAALIAGHPADTNGGWLFDFASDSDAVTNYVIGSDNDGIVRAFCRNDSGFGIALGTTDIRSLTRLFWVAGVFRSATDREVYVDGISEGTNTTDVPFNNTPNRFSLFEAGDSTRSNESRGTVLFPQMWPRALTPQEIKTLAPDSFAPFRMARRRVGFAEVVAAAEYLPLDRAHTPQHQSLIAR